MMESKEYTIFELHIKCNIAWVVINSEYSNTLRMGIVNTLNKSAVLKYYAFSALALFPFWWAIFRVILDYME